MRGTRLSEMDMKGMVPGEPITLAAVLAIMAIAVVAVVCYKLFTSSKGSAKIPTGWAFTWD